jgi:hypothetical protein
MSYYRSGREPRRSQPNRPVAEGCGCIALVIAVFLAVVLWQVTPELIAWLESTLRSNT